MTDRQLQHRFIRIWKTIVIFRDLFEYYSIAFCQFMLTINYTAPSWLPNT